MSYQNRLVAEINERLDELARAGEEWKAAWVAHAICRNHASGLADNEHEHFWRHCGYRDCRDEVRRCINRRVGDRPEPIADPQLRLPGFEHLQAYYVVRRGDDDVGVPIDSMTTDEIKAKAALYRAMGRSCFVHADELERYLLDRRNAA